RHSTKPWSWPQTPNTVSRWPSSPPMSLPDSPWPSAFPPAPRTSTTRRCATTRTCPSAEFATRATHLASAPPQPTSRPTPTPDGSPSSPRLLPILSDPAEQRKPRRTPALQRGCQPACYVFPLLAVSTTPTSAPFSPTMTIDTSHEQTAYSPKNREFDAPFHRHHAFRQNGHRKGRNIRRHP